MLTFSYSFKKIALCFALVTASNAYGMLQRAVRPITRTVATAMRKPLASGIQHALAPHQPLTHQQYTNFHQSSQLNLAAPTTPNTGCMDVAPTINKSDDKRAVAGDTITDAERQELFTWLIKNGVIIGAKAELEDVQEFLETYPEIAKKSLRTARKIPTLTDEQKAIVQKLKIMHYGGLTIDQVTRRMVIGAVVVFVSLIGCGVKAVTEDHRDEDDDDDDDDNDEEDDDEPYDDYDNGTGCKQ